MSEDRQVQPVTEPDVLKEQAKALRRSAVAPPALHQAYSPVQRLLILGLLVVTVGGSALLLLSADTRRHVLVRLGDEWTRLYQGDEARGIHKLPPPPARRATARIVVNTPILVQPTEPMLPTDTGAAERSPTKSLVTPSKNAQTEAAFRILREESPAAKKLFEGQVSGLQFKEWKPVQAVHPQYFIDLIAVRTSDQKEVHHIWSVNIADTTFEAMSQAARDLTATVQ